MSDVTPSSGIGTDTVQILPSQLLINPRYNVRPFSTGITPEEEQRIAELARSMESIGQLDAVLITPDRTLIAGHRRRLAGLLINERRTARGQSLFRLRCAVDHSGGDLRQKAIRSNIQRKETSAMDLAYLIVQIRKEYRWEGWAGAKKVAEYLGVADATITQHEHLLGIEKELQNQIHEGVISVQSAFKLVKHLATPEERAKAVERASQIQTEERLDKAIEAHLTGKLPIGSATTAIQNAVKTRIEHPAIVKAIRERHTTVATGPRRLSLTRAELIASISQFESDQYPSPLRDLAHYWAHTFAAGMGTTEDLRTRFLAIAQVPEPPRKPAQKAEALAC